MKSLRATLLAVVVAVTQLCARAADAPAKLAVIAETPAAATALDVLTAELSPRTDLQLLERAEVQRIYQEQALSAGNRDLIKLGQLLGADGLLFLQVIKEGTNQFLQAQLVAVKPGVIIGSTRAAWPLEQITEWAALTAKHFEPLYPKLTVLAKDAVPISILNLRSAMRTSASQALEREMTLLLIHRLSVEREVFVLERQRLGDVSFEKELQREESPFWTGSYLVEGVLDRDGFDPAQMTVNARLVPPQGGAVTTIDLTGARTNAIQLVEALTVKILAALHRNPGTNEWRSMAEAEQYFEEAKWAMRWGLKPEARAASESAWALGLQNTNVALLRIRSYTEGFSPRVMDEGHLYGGVDYGPYYARDYLKMPDQIRSAIRALELFSRDTARFFGGTNTPDYVWLKTGYDTLDRATGFLGEYHKFQDARATVESELAQLRAEARQTVALLGPYLAAGDVRPPGIRLAVRGDSRILSDWSLKWDWGGLWFEKPEDALPMYRQVIECGYQPNALPRFKAWSWADRQRIPGLEKQFVQELKSSTNGYCRIAGCFLPLVSASPAPAGDFESRIQEWADEVWRQRQHFYGDEQTIDLMAVQSLVRDKCGVPFYPQTAPLTNEPLASFMLRLRSDYLLNAPTYTNRAFWTMFPNHSDHRYSVREAEELPPLMVALTTRLNLSLADAKMVHERSETIARFRPTQVVVNASTAKASATNAGSALTTSKHDQPCIAQFNELKLPYAVGVNLSEFKLYSSQFRFGRMWFLIGTPAFTRWAGAFTDPKETKSVFVSLDVQSGRQEIIVVPETATRCHPSFLVTEDSIYATAKNHVLRYRFKDQRWETTEAPFEDGARLSQINGRIFLVTGDSILEFYPDGRTIQVMASARRRPAVDLLDDLEGFWGGDYPVLFPLGKNAMVAMAERRLFLRPLDRNEWKEISLPRFVGQWALSSRGGDDRALVGVGGNATRARLLELRPDGSFDALTDHRFRIEYRDPDADRKLPPPRWHWPPAEGLRGAFPVADGQSLWILSPNQWWARTNDSSVARLIRFEPEIPDPMVLSVQFMTNNHPFDVSGVRREGARYLSVMKTPAGLVVARNLGLWDGGPPGYWLIPQSLLESKLAEQRPMVRARAEAEKARQQAQLARFDTNKNGALDTDEITAMHLDPDFLEQNRATINPDNNDCLDVDELFVFDVNRDNVFGPEEREAVRLFNGVLARAALVRYDTNHDGKLQGEEWMQFANTNIPGYQKTINNSETKPVFEASLEAFDSDKDGALDAKELTGYMELRFTALDLAAYDYKLAEDAVTQPSLEKGKR